MNHKPNVFEPVNGITPCLVYFGGFIKAGPFAGPGGRILGIRADSRNRYRIYLGETAVKFRDVVIDYEVHLSFFEGLDIKTLGVLVGMVTRIKGASREMMDLNFFRF
jgi:hypothetical protein